MESSAERLERIKTKYGTIKIHLAELLKEKEISKYKLGRLAEMERTHINKYCNNDVTRFDYAVLVRICNVLDCTIDDILEYIPPEEQTAESK